MTYKQLYTENCKMIRLYTAYMPHVVKAADLFKLSNEISRLLYQNEQILALPVSHYTEDAMVRHEIIT